MTDGLIPFHKPPGGTPYCLKNELDEYLKDPATLCPRRQDRETGEENNYGETGLTRTEVEEIFKRSRKPEVPDDDQD